MKKTAPTYDTDPCKKCGNTSRYKSNRHCVFCTSQKPINKERKAFTDRRRFLFNTYGITNEQYEDMLTDQYGVCAICETTPGHKLLCVDHSHVTGKVRALLCNNCNAGIAMFSDSIAALQCAIEYLKQHSEA